MQIMYYKLTPGEVILLQQTLDYAKAEIAAAQEEGWVCTTGVEDMIDQCTDILGGAVYA